MTKSGDILEIFVIGGFSAHLNGEPIEIENLRPKLRGLLAAIAVESVSSFGRSIPVDDLWEALWGHVDLVNSTDRRKFRVTLGELRKELGDTAKEKKVLVTDDTALRANLHVDLADFVAAYNSADYHQALKVCEGLEPTLLAGFKKGVDLSWLDSARISFSEKLDECLIGVIEDAISSGDRKEAIRRQIFRRDLAERESATDLVRSIDGEIQKLRGKTSIGNAHPDADGFSIGGSGSDSDLVKFSSAALTAAKSKLIHHANEDAHPIRIPMNCVVRSSPDYPTLKVEDAFEQWLNDVDSNLMIVSGEFGAGKTSVLVDFVERQSRAERSEWVSLFFDFKDLALKVQAGESPIDLLVRHAEESLRGGSGPDPRSFVLAIDGFDELNLVVGSQMPRPDIRMLKPLLELGAKVAISCRSSSITATDELSHQLREKRRWKGLAVRSPHSMALKALDLQELRGISAELDRILEPLARLPGGGGRDIAGRPLFLQMILEAEEQPSSHDAKAPFTVGDLFRNYVESVLDRDFDRSESRIPSNAKWAALTGIASEMYGKPEGQTSGITTRDQIGIDYEKVNLRVMEAVTSAPTLQATGRLSDGYEWTTDFLASNSLLVDTGIGTSEGSRYQFIHGAFFEFFLAHSFLARIHRGESLGVDDHGPNVYQPLFDSLLLYFIAFILDRPAKAKLLLLAGRDDISHADRLLAIYLAEESPEIHRLLENASPNYRHFLETQERSGASHFLRKMAKYQLILLDQSVDRAFQYVDYLRELEKGEDLGLEWSLTSIGKSPTITLLTRLKAPHLVVAQPITVFRLKQFGDTAALGDLVELKIATDDPRLKALVDEAVETISHREDQNEAH